jgi:hypothetical protein
MDLKKEPVILDNSTVIFKMANSKGELLVNREAQIEDSFSGKILFYFLPEEINESGNMEAEIEVTYSDGLIETFPQDGKIPIHVESDL